jgi:predicted nucleotidyltransferase component of viral defense system
VKTKVLATSITQKLSNLAQKKGVPFQFLSTSFIIERLVIRLISDKTLKDALVFKGGYVGLRVYESPRYTIDLDALLMKSDLRKILEKSKVAAESDTGDGVWFRFEQEVDLKAQGEYGGIRLAFRAGIGEPMKNIKRAQIINFDIGIGDPVTPGPVKKEMLELIGSEELSWFVYPIETIIAEKLHALIDRGPDNSRAKDIFDLSQFLPMADKKILEKALMACFKYRKTELPIDIVDHISKINLNLLKRGWPSAISTVKNAPAFDVAFEVIIKELKCHMKSSKIYQP